MAATIKCEGVRLQKLKYTTTGCCLNWNSKTGKKSLNYPRSWQHSTHETCVDNNFGAGYTALALVTGDSSDIFVIDNVQIKKSGMRPRVYKGICLNEGSRTQMSARPPPESCWVF